MSEEASAREGEPRHFQMRCVQTPTGHWSHYGYDEVTAPAEIPPGLYRHFKGGLYDVLGTARQHDKPGEFVVYRSRQDGLLYLRSVHDFLAPVTVDDELSPRFQLQTLDVNRNCP